jgi:signal transduction histidine kinase
MANAVSRAVIEILLDRINQGAGTISSEGELLYSNQRLATMIGKPRAQLVGKPFAEIVAEADRDTLAAALSAGRDGAAQCQLALPRNHGHGDLQAVFTFAPLGHGQASCLVTDVGPTSMLRALSHEVRNMLGTVRTSVEVLKRTALEPDARRSVEAIERQTGKVLELLEQLRRVSPKE